MKPLLGGLRTNFEEEYGFWNINHAGNPVAIPPFTVRFSTTALDGHALLTGDEDGILTVLDTRRPLRDQMRALTPSQGPHARFRAHDNAVFDAIWLANDTRVASASGDGSVRVFDPETLFRTALCRGATASVKCIRTFGNSSSPPVISSCGRDGAIRVHDLRVPSVYDPSVCLEVFHQPVMTIENAHVPQPTISVPTSSTKRRRVFAAPAVTREGPSTASVTSIAVIPGYDHLLLSSGSADGSVKLWDLRGGSQFRRASFGSVAGGSFGRHCKARAVVTVTPSTERRADASYNNRRCHGIVSLDVDSSGSKLLASSTDSSIYIYDSHQLDLGHSRVLRGHSATSFYIRASFSPCGKFVSCGSADSKGYIWDLENGTEILDRPILQLDGHRGGEVSVVDWCKRDMLKLATCADDTTVKLWTVKAGCSAEGVREDGDEVSNSARFVDASQSMTRVECGGKKSGGGLTTGTRRLRDSDIRTFFRSSSSFSKLESSRNSKCITNNINKQSE